jgi:phosphatidylglycerol:prolipoprotein diacylglycerol transferase
MHAFWEWWQHLPQGIDPVIFQIGSFRLQYYGLMYLVAFGLTYVLVLYRIRHEKRFRITRNQINDLTTYAILGLIIGARMGYVIFYNPSYFVRHPLEIFLPFDFSDGVTFTGISGMSYHGGLIGIIAAAWLTIRKSELSVREVFDLYVPAIPLGYTFGRLGNFINGELYGRVTTAPIGMRFPLAPDPHLRHPSQLYEAFFEGIFLFLVLWQMRKLKTPPGSMLAFYLIGYGLVRWVIEFYRQPDAQLGFVFYFLSMGQVLCSGMILAGILLLVYFYRHPA